MSRYPESGRMAAFSCDFESLIIHFINQYIHNQAVAEEICQDVYLTLLEQYPDVLEQPEDVKKLAFKIAKNKALNYINKASTRYEISVSEILDYRAVVSEKDILKELLYDQLSYLSAAEQRVILGKIHDIPMEVLEKEMNRSRHALECIYSRAVKKLRKKILQKLNDGEN